MIKRLLLVICVVMASRAEAQTEAEYKTASGSQGCMAIPYSNHRDKCVTEQSDVKSWCDGKGITSCDELRIEGLLEQVKQLEEGAKKRNAENKPKEANELESKKKTVEAQIQGNKKEAERRAYNNDQCIQYRERVQRVFKDAQDRAKSEKSDSSKTNIHPHLDKIISELGSGFQGHAVQIQDVKNRMEFCKKLQ